jgi:hypothetical protein
MKSDRRKDGIASDISLRLSFVLERHAYPCRLTISKSLMERILSRSDDRLSWPIPPVEQPPQSTLEPGRYPRSHPDKVGRVAVFALCSKMSQHASRTAERYGSMPGHTNKRGSMDFGGSLQGGLELLE